MTPNIFDGSGGIARIACSLALALSEACLRRGWRLSVLALNDHGVERDERYLPKGAEYCEYGGNKVALGRALLKHAYGKGFVATVFCHVNLATLGLLLPLRWNESNRRYSVVAHGVDVWTRLKLHRRVALQMAAEVWPVSGYTAQMLEKKQGVSTDRIRRIYNCLDPFWQDVSSRVATKRPYVLSVSRLARTEEQKGIGDLIAAFGKIAAAAPEYDLVVAGSGEDMPRLKALAAELIGSDRVHFTGYLPDEELKRLYRDCAYFALPSAKEGFGLVYLEAMAQGKAVIAARSGGAPEVVVHGETGLLVPFGDVEALAETMKLLCEKCKYAESLGRAGKVRLEKMFTYRCYRNSVDEAIGRLWCH